jgi:serine/threonine protein phosphatase PrpC
MSDQISAQSGMLDSNEGAGTRCAVATFSTKATNQDACRTFANPVAHLSGVVVADGLGSQYQAEVAATFAVGELCVALERVESADSLDFAALFTTISTGLTAHVRALPDLPADLKMDQAFGTTLLCAVDAPGRFIIAYVGNGAILQVRGDFNTFPETQLLPWSAINLLNPHSAPVRGRNALYKFLAPYAESSQIAPTVITISKDDHTYGDIIVVCSDGIASLDQTPVGWDDQQQIWISAEPKVTLFYEHLSTLFLSEPMTDVSLTAALEAYLAALAARRLVSDDCTIGVLVSERTRRFQAQRRATVEKEQDVVRA